MLSLTHDTVCLLSTVAGEMRADRLTTLARTSKQKEDPRGQRWAGWKCCQNTSAFFPVATTEQGLRGSAVPIYRICRTLRHRHLTFYDIQPEKLSDLASPLNSMQP